MILLGIRPFYGTALAGARGMQIRSAFRDALAVAVLAVPSIAAAQPAAPPPPPPRHEATAEFAFVGTTGNASTQTIGLGGESIYRPAPWTWKNKAAFVRSKAESELKAQTLLFLTRAERAIRTRLAAFGEYGYFRDEFAGVNHRNSVVGGLTYKLIDRAAHLLSIDGVLGYLNEDRIDADNISSGTYGTGASYRWKLSETATITDEARFIGTFADANDWRILQSASVTARLTEVLALKLSNTVGYVNDPVPGFKATDTNTSIALVAKF
jgi:putative salt-induced outer membrane protein